jgi:hypothetical protein
MQRYTTVKADADPSDVALALVVDAELFRIEASVRWLDGAQVRLRGYDTPTAGPVPDVATATEDPATEGATSAGGAR